MNDDVIFGLHAVSSLIKKQPKRVLKLWIQESRQDDRVKALVALAKHQHISIEPVSRKQLDQQVSGRHQGVIAFAKAAQMQNEHALEALLDKLQHEQLDRTTPQAQTARTPFLLVLDGITDPHNLGACLRTAEAAGVQAVIAPKDRSAPLNATASKVASGAAESLPYIQVTNLARTLKHLQQRGIWIYGTAGEAENSLFQTDLQGPIAIVMGAEGEGLRRLTREHCDHLIRIPMTGSINSLNISVATGVCLFEALRQRTSS